MSKKKVSIVILNYNGKHFLKDCFEAVLASQYPSFEVIVVDNASTDGSAEFISKNYPQVKLLKLKNNFGFAKGNNFGIRAAKGDYIVLLNNDTAVDKNWLSELTKAVETHPDVGFCATKMVWFKDPSFIDNAGIIYNWKGKGWARGQNEKDKGQYDKQEYVFGACNGAAFYRKGVFKKIGLLDDNFFLIADDIDFSFRAQLAGFKCLYVPRAVVRHAGGGTVATWNEIKSLYSARHHIYIIIKNFPLKYIFQNFPQIIIERLRNLSGLLKSAPFWRWPYLVTKTYLKVFLKLPEMLAKRRFNFKNRKVSDDYLGSIILRADFKSN